MTAAMATPPTPSAAHHDAATADDGDDGDGDGHGADRRFATRVLVDLEVDCETDENYLFASIIDISITGIFIRTDAPQPAGTHLNLRFAAPRLRVVGGVQAPGEVRALFETDVVRRARIANDAAPGDARPAERGPAHDWIAVEGVVAWVNPLRPGQVDNLHPGMGVRFVELDDADRRRLERLITRMAYLPE